MTVTRAMEVRTMEIQQLLQCPQNNSSAENDNDNDNDNGGTASTVLRPASVLADAG